MTGSIIDAPEVERRRYDRRFDAAIHEGCLTIEQAISRGNRETYARHLGLRYGLPDELALRVTDNRARLADVLQAIGRIPGSTPPRPAAGAPARRQLVVVMLGLTMLAGLLGFQQWQQQRDIGRRLEILQLADHSVVSAKPIITAPAAPEPEPASIETDELGRVTRVSARRPDDLLAALCGATLHGSCFSMQVYPSEPPFPGRRLGRVMISESAETFQALAIRRDRRTGRWVVGTGLAPILSSQDAEVRAHRCLARDGTDCVTVSGSAE